MITASQISKRLGVEVYRVRWLLQELRNRGLISCEKIGQTYSYENKALRKVKDLLQIAGKLRQ